MKKSILALSLSLSCVVLSSGQDVQSRSAGSASSQTSATSNTSSVELQTETRVSAELEKSVDARKANVGDEVVLKTTQAIKSDGRVIVDKGARLFGRVTDVAKNSNSGPSRIGILFNRLEKGPLAMQIRASITSITTASTSARLSDDDSFAGAGTSSRSTSSSGSSTLIGAGGVISSTSAVLGSTVNSTQNTVGTTTSGLGKTLGTIQISQSSNTSVQGESVLSLQGGNLRLEKGTKFNLVVTQSANAGGGREQ